MRTVKRIISTFIFLLITGSAYSQLKNGFKLTLNNAGYSDESVIRFFGAATTSFDTDYDAYKLKNVGNNPNLYTEIENTTYSINSLPDSFINVDLTLHAEVAFSGLYTLKFDEIWESDSLCSVTLIDKLLNFSQDLKAKPIYSFNCEEGSASDRFILNFKRKVDTITDEPDNTFSQLTDSTTHQIADISTPLKVVCTGNRITIVMEEMSNEVLVVLNDLSGKEVTSTTLVPITETVNLMVPANGFHVIKVIAGNHQYFGKVYIESL